jgi:hypothetical protein
MRMPHEESTVATTHFSRAYQTAVRGDRQGNVRWRNGAAFMAVRVIEVASVVGALYGAQPVRGRANNKWI